MSAVKRNLLYYSEKHCDISIDTIYFGGGTPSLLKAEMFEDILKTVSDNFDLLNPEISLEANPGTVNLEQLKDLRKIGFNRISFGVQSFCDDELKMLGRLHDSKTAIKAIWNARLAGFSNISADLMMGIIGQELYSMDNNIKILSKLPVSHISAYMLKIEHGTAYDTEEIYDKIPDDDSVSDLYLYAVNEFEKSGFKQYEISNFSKEGYECKHNLHYWHCDEYIGIGPSAHSHFNGKRYAAPRSLEEFIKNEHQTEEVTDENPATFSEYAMLQLRLMEGLDLEFCKNKYGIQTEKIIKDSTILEENGLVEMKKSVIKLTPKGCLVSNLIIGKLLN